MMPSSPLNREREIKCATAIEREKNTTRGMKIYLTPRLHPPPPPRTRPPTSPSHPHWFRLYCSQFLPIVVSRVAAPVRRLKVVYIPGPSYAPPPHSALPSGLFTLVPVVNFLNALVLTSAGRLFAPSSAAEGRLPSLRGPYTFHSA